MPVGSFYYAPGVRDERAQIFSNSNAMLGQALMSLFAGLAQQKERNQLRLDALNHDSKSADGAFNADLAQAGEDPNAERDVLARWNLGSPDEWRTLSAQDKVARRDGVIGAEQILKWSDQRKRAKADEAGAALLPRVLANARYLGDTQPTMDEDGNPLPAQSQSKLLFKAINELSPDEQKVFGQSSAGQSLLTRAMTASDRDDLQTAREAAITDRAREREQSITERWNAREKGLQGRHAENLEFLKQKEQDLASARAQRGKVTPETVYKALESTKRAIITAKASAEMMGNKDEAAALDKKLQEIEGQQGALRDGNNGNNGKNIPTINTQAEYDALPAGAAYYDSTGKLGHKGGKAAP